MPIELENPVWIAGSSGLIGTSLTDSLRRQGVSVRRLLRSGASHPDDILWNPRSGDLDASALEGAAALVNLAGAGIGEKRWSAARKREIEESRIKPTKLLVSGLKSLNNPPRVFVSASAIGFYGERGGAELTEADEPGEGFMARLCERWEEAAAGASETTRTVMLRTGLVTTASGGFLRRQLPLFKLGLGGRLGSPHRWLSWISLPDTTAAIERLLSVNVSGPVNLTAPNPVTNSEFTRALGRALRRPAVIPTPKAAVAMLLGSEAVASLTESAKVLPAKLIGDGFEFKHPHLQNALADALGVRT